jgi:hypothetical protein
MGNGVRVQSGMTFAKRPPSPSTMESSGPGSPSASSHFSRATSTPPVFSALYADHRGVLRSQDADMGHVTGPTLLMSHRPKPWSRV